MKLSNEGRTYASEVYYKLAYYHTRTSDVGQLCLINGLCLIYLGEVGVYRPFVESNWEFLDFI